MLNFLTIFLPFLCSGEKNACSVIFQTSQCGIWLVAVQGLSELGYMFCFVVTLGKTYKMKAWPGHAPLALTVSQRQDISEQQLPFKPGFSFALSAKVKFLKKIHPNNSLECLPWRLSAAASLFKRQGWWTVHFGKELCN